MAVEASANGASRELALMNPGALRLGTSTTLPSKTPMPSFVSTIHVPVDLPPITGSLSSVNLCVAFEFGVNKPV